MSTPPASLAWQVALACLLALAALWWFTRGARRWARRRSLRRSLARLGAVEGAGRLQIFDTVRQGLSAGATEPRAQTLYDRPWVLFLGDPQSRMADLLRAAGPATDADGDLGGGLCRRWTLPGLVALETDTRLAALEDEDSPAAREVLADWYRTLLTLAERRDALPLDGLVLCVDARTLLAGPQTATTLAARLRRRADDASQHLRLRLPTQVLVTGLDQLPGFAAVREALPAGALQQAVGFRMPPGTMVIIDDVLDDLSGRLRALRMALLRQQGGEAGQRAVHEFFLQWLALQAGLGAFLKRLFTPSSSPYRLRGRGLYYVAAPPDGQGAFVNDLFGHFLPLERAFAKPRR